MSALFFDRHPEMSKAKSWDPDFLIKYQIIFGEHVSNISNLFILVLSGVSGAGKTTLLNALSNSFPLKSVECLNFDSIGVPAVDEMIKKYGSPSQWQQAMMDCWAEKFFNNYRHKNLIIFEGQVNLNFIESAFQKYGFKNYAIVLVHCSDEVRHDRLLLYRNQPELVNKDMDNWAQFLKEQALTKNISLLDSGKMTVDQMLDWVIAHFDLLEKI